MDIVINRERIVGKRNPMIYGHFIEHFHRQIYGGVFDPENPLSDEQGFRTDVIDAMRKIKVPILRWPGGCFVSSYHWKDAVGKERTPVFDKAWRVEDPNSFGTDEYIDLCRKVGCEPYICTNAGTGTAEEMSDWVEYCNLENEGKFAKWRIENGHEKPYNVKYWSIGNENYGHWEIGAKDCDEWGKLVRESAKMMKHVDPNTELTAAALTDLDWNINLLRNCGHQLDWISIHEYWDRVHEHTNYATYEQVMQFSNHVEDSINKVRGLLTAMGLEKKIKIAFDEWNLRGWYHPNVHTLKIATDKKDYLYPRDKNDINSVYTMADAVFTACFLNGCNRNCDIVGMANFAPIVNTRGCIYTHKDGIVLRTTYHVFDMFVNILGDTVLDSWNRGCEKMSVVGQNGCEENINMLDVLATEREDGATVVSAVNRNPDTAVTLSVCVDRNPSVYRVHTLAGESTESFNDIDHNGAAIETGEWKPFVSGVKIELRPHSVNMIEICDKI